MRNEGETGRGQWKGKNGDMKSVAPGPLEGQGGEAALEETGCRQVSGAF